MLKEESGDNDMEAPPVPIPNTEVKLHSADDTWWATARESRSLPDIYGGVAQLARANGSYPLGRWFKSTRRYQTGRLHMQPTGLLFNI